MGSFWETFLSLFFVFFFIYIGGRFVVTGVFLGREGSWCGVWGIRGVVGGI